MLYLSPLDTQVPKEFPYISPKGKIISHTRPQGCRLSFVTTRMTRSEILPNALNQWHRVV